MKSRSSPWVIAAIGIASISLAPIAHSEKNYNNYEGTTGSWGGWQCINPTCNNSDGCSWITNQYNWYYPMSHCVDVNEGDPGVPCVHTMRLCRIQKFYEGGGCAIPVISTTNFYKAGCSGGGGSPP